MKGTLVCDILSGSFIFCTKLTIRSLGTKTFASVWYSGRDSGAPNTGSTSHKLVITAFTSVDVRRFLLLCFNLVTHF